jgi:hypothetical protein
MRGRSVPGGAGTAEGELRERSVGVWGAHHRGKNKRGHAHGILMNRTGAQETGY